MSYSSPVLPDGNTLSIAYAPDVLAMFRRAAVFVDKILQGTPPGDIPLEPPHQLRLL
jgi:hypothetical protein